MIQLKHIFVALFATLFWFWPAQVLAEPKVTALNVINTGNGTFVVKIDFSQQLTAAPATFTINTPPRIVIDFPGVSNGMGKSLQEFGEGDLRSAHIIQAGARTRTVLNLGQMLAYDTKVNGNSFLINLRGQVAAQVNVNRTERFAENAAATTGGGRRLTNVDFRPGKLPGEGKVLVDLSDANAGIDVRRQGTKLVVDFLKTSLPANLRRKLDVADFGTVVDSINTFVKGNVVEMVIEPKGNWEYSAYQADKKFIVEVRSAVDPNAGKETRAGRNKFNGDKLSLEFQNIAVREALNVIADFTNNNMVISDSVSGYITLRLKDVPWDQALNIILQAKGLDYRQVGNVIQVAPREELAAKEKADLADRNAIAQLEDVRTEAIQIKYAKAMEIRTILMTPAAGGAALISKRGSVSADVRSNVLFIQETPTRLEEIRTMIDKIDIPMRQVMIEGRIVIANNKFGRSLGSKMTFTNNNTTGVAITGGGNGVAGTVTGANVNLPATGAAGTFSMLLFNRALTKNLALELTALETDNQGKVISSPRVLTMDQKPATIAQGVKIPYVTPGTATTPAGVSFIDANLSLMVTPQITPDDHVIIDVTVTKDSPQAVTTGTPPIDTNRVQTQALVENGGTIVIGGVYQQDNSTSVTKVPLLGDIPILGYLFRNKTTADNKTELLIFITPKIIKDAMDLN